MNENTGTRYLLPTPASWTMPWAAFLKGSTPISWCCLPLRGTTSPGICRRTSWPRTWAASWPTREACMQAAPNRSSAHKNLITRWMGSIWIEFVEPQPPFVWKVGIRAVCVVVFLVFYPSCRTTTPWFVYEMALVDSTWTSNFFCHDLG